MMFRVGAVPRGRTGAGRRTQRRTLMQKSPFREQLLSGRRGMVKRKVEQEGRQGPRQRSPHPF